jgi:uncharacterized protein (UPF0332 family)
MKEVESLIQKAKKYIKSAEKLIKEKDYESAVSRTYYAYVLCDRSDIINKRSFVFFS